MMRWPPSEAGISRLGQAARKHWPLLTGDVMEVHQRENVICRAAAAEDDCALRLHRPGLRSAAQLASELAFMEMLRSSGLSVPQPRETVAGRHLAMLSHEGAELQASLLSWLPGRPFGKSRVPLPFDDAELAALFRTLGAAVAALHEAADRWTPPERFTRPVLDLDGLLGELPVWGRFWELSGVDAATLARLAAVRSALRERLERLAPRMSFGLVHADVVRENVLVHGGRVSFIDFDDCGFGFRIYDLATCLVKSRFEPRYGMMQSALLAGYQSVRELTEEELQALPLFIAVRALSLVGWMEQRIADPDAVPRRDQFLAEALNEAGSVFQLP
jgi:Ser/Thr protein kinase RdoA (MazF antagonist)